jgi:hypothetical protein
VHSTGSIAPLNLVTVTDAGPKPKKKKKKEKRINFHIFIIIDCLTGQAADCT